MYFKNLKATYSILESLTKHYIPFRYNENAQLYLKPNKFLCFELNYINFLW